MSEPATDDHNAQVLFGQGDDEADHPGIARSSLVRSVITKLQTNGDLVYPRHRHWLLSWIYSSPFLQLAALKTQTVLCPQLEVHRDELITTDGGVVSIDWVDSSLELPPNAPLLAVLPTLCGSAQTHRAWLRGLSAETGFRVAVLNRRGHGGLTLRTPRFNVFGDPTDTRLQLEHIRQAFPESTFLGAIGISAGSAQVATYLGTSGADSLVDAAVCACPAYDISTAFGFLTMGSPRLDGLLLRSVQSHWLGGESGCTLANAADLDPAAAEALRQARQASTMEEFVEAHTYFAGCADGAEQYYEEHNPMSHFQSIAKPVLLLNAGDDPVSLHATIPTEVPVHGAALVQTAFGSHAAFVDGVYLERSWMMDVSTAFLKECSLALAAPSSTRPSDR